jgi:aspartyl-tRNA(Asn)/glutamyl-tRNA(Gln) amidotransferase subunit A
LREEREDGMNLVNNGDLTIMKIAPLIRKKKLSPVELVNAMLARIERLQPVLNAFITVTSRLARSQARQAEKEISKGHYRGPLHGIPISVKDLYYTAGIRTTGGSKILRNFIPRENAVVIERLFAAGCVLLGKNNLHEFAYGVTNQNPHFGSTLNPWDLKRIPGGSSGGSAVAVSAALSLASLGTDTGGSIRIPAAACGVVGLKPTQGLVPLQGIIPLSFSQDHAGPLCRSVEDVALVLRVIAGRDWGKLNRLEERETLRLHNLRKGVRGIRMGVPKQYFFNQLQKEVRSHVLAALKTLEGLGAKSVEVNPKLMDETDRLSFEIVLAEAVAYHWKWLKKRGKDYGEDVRSRMEGGFGQLSRTYLEAQQRRQLYIESFEQALESVDVLVAPTLPVVAPRIGETEVREDRAVEDVRAALLRLTRPGNLAGLPALTIPCGFSMDGLPIGLQLIGRRFGEGTILRVAYAYEQATPWHRMFPPDPPTTAEKGTSVSSQN